MILYHGSSEAVPAPMLLLTKYTKDFSRTGVLHPYDIVSGPMADHTIWDYVQDFLDGTISRAAFLELAKFRHPTHQISFHTIAALKTLRGNCCRVLAEPSVLQGPQNNIPLGERRHPGTHRHF